MGLADVIQRLVSLFTGCTFVKIWVGVLLIHWLADKSVFVPVTVLAVFVAVERFVATSAFLEVRRWRVTMVTMLDWSC